MCDGFSAPCIRFSSTDSHFLQELIGRVNCQIQYKHAITSGGSMQHVLISATNIILLSAPFIRLFVASNYRYLRAVGRHNIHNHADNTVATMNRFQCVGIYAGLRDRLSLEQECFALTNSALQFRNRCVVNRQIEAEYAIRIVNAGYAVVESTAVIKHSSTPCIGQFGCTNGITLFGVIHNILVQYQTINTIATIYRLKGFLISSGTRIYLITPFIRRLTMQRSVLLKQIRVCFTNHIDADAVATILR